MPDQIKKKKPKETDKQNPVEVKDEIRQSSEFEKKELFDPNKIAALIDKSKEETADIQQKKSLEIKKKIQNYIPGYTRSRSLHRNAVSRGECYGYRCAGCGCQ